MHLTQPRLHERFPWRCNFVFDCHLASARQKPPKDRTKIAQEFNKSAALLRRPRESVSKFNFWPRSSVAKYSKNCVAYIHNSFSVGPPINTLVVDRETETTWVKVYNIVQGNNKSSALNTTLPRSYIY